MLKSVLPSCVKSILLKGASCRTVISGLCVLALIAWMRDAPLRRDCKLLDA